MHGERFYAEHFRGVMSAEQKIHAQFFRGNCSPMRRLTGNERVDFFICDPVNFRASRAGYYPDRTRPFWTEIENLHRAIQRLLQFANEFAARQGRAHLQPDRLTPFFQERLRSFGLRRHVAAFQSADMSARSKRQTERGGQLCVVANSRVYIQREMRTVKRDIIFKCDPQLPAQRVSYRLQPWPEQPVMHD